MKIYTIKISLRGAKPPIWRRLKLNSDYDLGTLHYIIQDAMGWGNSHLYEFYTADKKRIGEIYDDGFDDEEDKIDSSKVTIKDVLKKPKSKMTYVYDFGDNWEHDILLEKIEEGKEMDTPICLTGKKACPPDDCGGLWGYYDMLEALKDPKHPEHEDIKEWLGEDFDPDYFDKDEVNERFA